MPTILDLYRAKRDAARAEMKRLRLQIQEIIDATDLLWREKISLINHTWKDKISPILIDAEPLTVPGMHHSQWQLQFGGSEDRYQEQCGKFIKAMDQVLETFPATVARKRTRRPASLSVSDAVRKTTR